MDLKGILKKILIVIGIIISLVLIGIVYFIIDRPLDSDFTVYMESDSKPSDDQNGFFTLMGLYAPANESAHAYGLKKSQQAQKFYQNEEIGFDSMDLILDPDVQDGNLPVISSDDQSPDNLPRPYNQNVQTESLDCWLLPELELNFSAKKFEQKPECMDAVTLKAHIQEIEIPLSRYEEMIQYPRFYEVWPLTTYVTIDLLAIHPYFLARNIIWVRNGDEDKAMNLWLENIKFINRALEDNQSAMRKAALFIMAAQSLDSLYLMLEINPVLATRYKDKIIETLSHSVIKNHEDFIKSTFSADYRMTIQPLDHLAGVGSWFYKKDATANMLVSYYRDILEASRLPPETIDQNIEKIRQHYEEKYPSSDMPIYQTIWVYWSYNPIGKFLTMGHRAGSELLLKSPWRYEANRRMAILYVTALSQKIEAAAMPDFLKNAPAALHDPFTEKPFAWDPARQTIFYMNKNMPASDLDNRREVVYP